MNTFFIIYLSGIGACLLVLLLNLVFWGLVKMPIDMATGSWHLSMQIKQFTPKKPWIQIGFYSGTFIMGLAFSWISALFMAWFSIVMVFGTVAQLFQRMPQKAADLMWPLKRGEYLPTEEVWARLIAADIETGIPRDGCALAFRVCEDNKNRKARKGIGFDMEQALKRAHELGAFDQETLGLALRELRDKE